MHPSPSPAAGSAPPTPEARFEVNGESRPLPRPPSVEGALAELGLSARPVAVEVNGRLVRRARHAATRIAPGDRVEIVSFVGGG